MTLRLASVALLALASVGCPDADRAFEVGQYTLAATYKEHEPFDGESHERILRFSNHEIHALVATITPPNDEPYSYYAIHYLPGIPAEVGTEWAHDYRPEDAPAGLQSKTKTVQGPRDLSWGVSPGDPNGEYRIEIWIENKLVSTLVFEVSGVPPAV